MCFRNIIANYGNSIEQPNKNFEIYVMILNINYYIVDMLYCRWYEIDDYKLYLHHILTLGNNLFIIYFGYGGYIASISLFFLEMSHPFMTGRGLLPLFGLKYTKIYDLMENLYFVSYIIGRGILNFIVLYFCWTSKNIPLLFCISNTLIQVQSSHFVYLMVGIIKRNNRIKKMIEVNGGEKMLFNEDSYFKSEGFKQLMINSKSGKSEN